jgi:hypothetical protein
MKKAIAMMLSALIAVTAAPALVQAQDKDDEPAAREKKHKPSRAERREERRHKREEAREKKRQAREERANRNKSSSEEK